MRYSAGRRRMAQYSAEFAQQDTGNPSRSRGLRQSGRGSPFRGPRLDTRRRARAAPSTAKPNFESP